MRDRFRHYSENDTERKVFRRHVFQHWWMRVLAALASVVVFCTVYALILPATAVSVDDAASEEGFYLEANPDESFPDQGQTDSAAETTETITSDTGDTFIAGSNVSNEGAIIDINIDGEDGNAQEGDPFVGNLRVEEAEEVEEEQEDHTEEPYTEPNGEATQPEEEIIDIEVDGEDASAVDEQSSADGQNTSVEQNAAVEQTAPVDQSAAAEQSTSVEQSAARELTALKMSDYYISAAFDASAGIPSDASLHVREILPGTSEYNVCMSGAQIAAEDNKYADGEISYARFFDFTILDADGQEITPSAPVSISIFFTKESSIEIAENVSANKVFAVHFDGTNNKINLIRTQTECSESLVSAVWFDADSLSITGVIYTGEVSLEETETEVNGEALRDSEVSSEASEEEISTEEVSAEETDTIEKSDNEDSSEEETESIEASDSEASEKEAESLEEIESAVSEGETEALGEIDSETSEAESEVSEEYTDGQLKAYKAFSYSVTLDYTSSAGIPSDASLYVREILPGTDEYDSYLSGAQTAVEDNEAATGEVSFARFFDITILNAAGQEITPAAPVSVNITFPKKEAIELAENGSPEEVLAVHFDEENDNVDLIETETKGTQSVISNISFEAETFSVYGIIYTVDFHWEVNGESH